MARPSFVQVILVIVGLYLVVVNLYDMLRDPNRTNIGLQAISVAIGGGLIVYAFNFVPLVKIIDDAKSAIISSVKEVGSAVGVVVKEGDKKPYQGSKPHQQHQRK